MFQVGAVIHESGSGALSCPLMDALETVEESNAASAKRLLVYFEKVAESGFDVLNDKQCHVVDAQEKIYEFIAGKLRVLFFAGTPKSLVVCTHMFLKKTRKTPSAEVAKAVRLKAEYEMARLNGLVEWKDEI